jgi:trk system potassium uptake protein TrkH
MLSLHTKFVLLVSGILVASGFVMIFIFEYSNPNTLGSLNFGEKLLAALFHAVTPRTAGFNTLPMDQLTVPTKFLTIIHMFIGGSPGSTAGGVKTTTMGLVILLIVSVITGKEDIEFSKRRFQTATVMRALAILGIGLFIVITVTLFLSFTEPGLKFIDIFFEAISAFATVGLSLGITSKLSIAGKIIITITMFFGRLGPLTIAMALARRQAKKQLYRYPEGRIMVG